MHGEDIIGGRFEGYYDGVGFVVGKLNDFKIVLVDVIVCDGPVIQSRWLVDG